MRVEISTTCEKKKAELIKRIRAGSINVLEAKALNHACYFCCKHIDDKMVVLIDVQGDESETEERYPLHKRCYEDAKVFPFYN